MEVGGRGKEAGMAAWREGDREKGIVDGGKEVGPELREARRGQTRMGRN